jgi:hypothetical protein
MSDPGAGRRTFLKALGVTGVAVAGVGALATPASADLQPNWRFCDRCYMLFYDGYPAKGWCWAGGAHRAQGWNFRLPYYVLPGDNRQTDWRFCERCYGIFYEPGHDGPCPSGGFHQAQGWVFTLTHGVGETPTRQQHWRYCWECTGLFYWGFAGNGICAGGDGHIAQGYDFCLDHY